MTGRIIALVLAIVVSVSGLPYNLDQRSWRVIENIHAQGYPAELHHVTTSDGYILTMHRIPHGRNGTSTGKRPIAFVMHGLMSASSHWLLIGPEYSLGYNLADAGYDVWMGNHRGNIYSRAHISLRPDHRREKMTFFDYSWEEVGLIDIPAMVDYALAQTGQEKLHYIGHSQGGTVFLVLNSMRPEYNSKFASAHLLAGVGYMANFPFLPLRAIAQSTSLIYTMGRTLGIVEISFDALPFSEQVKIEENGLVDYCAGDEQYKQYCEMIGVPYLVEDRILGITSVPVMGGCSLKQIAHFGQNVRDKTFRRWDYGTAISNLLNYGTRNPPAYDLSKITVDVTMHYSDADILLGGEDVLAMAAVMPNTQARRLERASFRHSAYLFSRDVKTLVTDYIIEKMNETPV